MSKDYSQAKHLTLGHLSHTELAAKLLNQTRSSEELLSVVRAGHDRILHLHHHCQHNTVADAPAEALQPGQRTSEEQTRIEHASEVRDLQARIDALTIERDAAVVNAQNAEIAVNNIGQQLNDATAKLESQQAELTTAYLAKGTAESEAAALRAELKDIRDNYEIEGEEEEPVEGTTTGAQEDEAVSYYKPSRDELRDIAVARGFRVRPQPNGKEDLNDYVYDTIYDGIKLSHEKTQQ